MGDWADFTTAYELAGLTTGRGGSGSGEAKVEQRIILDLLKPAHSGGCSHPK
jgi:hypothetical protein